jgi:uncharacterized protein YyaL (SSP411 family)
VSNRLATAQSPYLLHHAEQPVDWYPWGTEALACAQREDKPILLSIGYDACHWCHVMAAESFSDGATAALMNEGFINIKVDKEERPDIDQLYQHTHQLLRRNGGGWPLTVFLSPQGIPFYSGTYFPREAQQDLPAFKDILASVSTVWRDQREALTKQDQAIVQRLTEQAPRASDAPLNAEVRAEASQQLATAFDKHNGGFGAAPKFPHPTDLAFLLRRGRDEQDTHAQHMALFTLHKMAEGGLFDQISGGFFRYSVDTTWQVPHFEKLLCDNALLIAVYADALAMMPSPLYYQVIERTVEWVLRDMRLASGGLRASLPADDKNGLEGGAYTWASEDLRTALKPNEWDVCSAHWGLIDPPNVDGARWHLHVARTSEALARTLGYPAELVDALVASARDKLQAVRAQSVKLKMNDQVLTSWQALMVTALVRAATVCDRPEWLEAARAALNFIRETRWVDGAVLMSSPGQEAFLDDYAFVLEAVLALHDAAPHADDLAFAQSLAETLLFRFEDSQAGGFFFTPHNASPLFFRSKPGMDTATPSGNGTAALALLALSKLRDGPRYKEAARRCVDVFASTVRHDPTSHTRLLQAAQQL